VKPARKLPVAVRSPGSPGGEFAGLIWPQCDGGANASRRSQAATHRQQGTHSVTPAAGSSRVRPPLGALPQRNELGCEAGAGAEYRPAGGSRSRARNRPAPAQRRLQYRSPVAQRAGKTPARSCAPVSHVLRGLEFRQGLGSEAPAGRSAHTSESRIYRLCFRPPNCPSGRLSGRSQLTPTYG
jgi:hypothetical protein